ncbi:hypothetical protein cje68_03114, partial [Campylobacter jejuni subsp. jejuni 1577]
KFLLSLNFNILIIILTKISFILAFSINSFSVSKNYNALFKNSKRVKLK